jgi:hypothetical protein
VFLPSMPSSPFLAPPPIVVYFNSE